MSKRPNISVIVPVYNVEKYLIRCVNSILNQEYHDFELILVDDGSPDQSPQICDNLKLRDSRIQVVHKENGGLSDARNAGLKVARGDYIAFVDSDDVVSKHYLSILYNALSNSECDIAVCSFAKFSKEISYEPIVEEKPEIVSGYEMLNRIYSEDHMEYLQTVVAWNKLYRKSLFDNIHFPKGMIHEDEATTYRLYFKAEKVALVQSKLYFYYQNNEGIMKRKFNVNRLDYLLALRDRYNFYMENGLDGLATKTASLLYTYTVDYASLDKQAVEEYSIFMRELRKIYSSYRKILLKQKFDAKTHLRLLLSKVCWRILTFHF